MSIIYCYNRVRPVESDSGMCRVDVLSMYGQTIGYTCSFAFNGEKNWVTMDSVAVDTTASRIIEQYYYCNGTMHQSDRTREYLGTFQAGIKSNQCIPTFCIYGQQIGNICVVPEETTCTREVDSKKSGEGEDEQSENEKKSVNIIWSEDETKETTDTADVTTDTEEKGDDVRSDEQNDCK